MGDEVSGVAALQTNGRRSISSASSPTSFQSAARGRRATIAEVAKRLKDAA